MSLRKSNNYIFDVEVKLIGTDNWYLYAPSVSSEDMANAMATILAGNSNILGVRISKWIPNYQLIEDKVYKDFGNIIWKSVVGAAKLL